ncbi:sulfate/molybdate ABC transporter ATP-binding protein [Nocardioides donggukensis]|uniref:ABC transporter ATP-binding protein n=1 Tax=Nocardioides donggukensis TaxID=2774019 RepID=A0A927K9R5_9ACTN|nr:ABC transporter ATP-binding protein [Nocardioides donggukensis]MBD8870371.1 ABC transporter ATP-binding protein [Nocardioides donggukensis]
MSFDVRLTVPGRLEAGLTAADGDVVAVIGPNGAGKSTLVRALAGLVQADGHARLDGVNLLRVPARDRHVGLVFQDQMLFPHLTARDNVAFGPRARGVPRAEADAAAVAWLDRLGVAELAGRRPRQLSGGQAQRVAIARALAADPRLLLLDEPMAGLDVGVATSLRLELSAHLAEFTGVTLLVTHDAIDALTIASHVLVVDEGRVAQFGTPLEVSQQPATDHVARLVGLNVLRRGDLLRAFSPTAVTVDVQEPHGSARNRWPGRVAAVSPHGGTLRLVVRTTDGPELIADVTPAAATELGLTPGRAVWLSVKESSVRSYAAAPA